jgi:long-subunit fatty acid transport protein
MISSQISSRILCIISFFFFAHNLQCQGYSFSGSRSQALANASVCLSDVFAYHNNPANAAGQKEVSFGLAYENRFLLKELQHQSYAVLIPLNFGVLSVGGNSFGYLDFRTFKNGVGYSMKILEELSLGVQINHHLIRLAAPYGLNQTVTGELGLSYKVTEAWNFGMAVFNIGRNELIDNPIERYSTSMRLGTSYKISNMVLAVAEIEKDISHPLRFKSGIEYSPDNNLLFRIGFATNPIELSFGIGWVFSDRYFLDFGSQFHQVLGWSPNFSFRFDINK